MQFILELFALLTLLCKINNRFENLEFSGGFRFFIAPSIGKCRSLEFYSCLPLLFEPNALFSQILRTLKNRKNVIRCKEIKIKTM